MCVQMCKPTCLLSSDFILQALLLPFQFCTPSLILTSPPNTCWLISFSFQLVFQQVKADHLNDIKVFFPLILPLTMTIYLPYTFQDTGFHPRSSFLCWVWTEPQGRGGAIRNGYLSAALPAFLAVSLPLCTLTWKEGSARAAGVALVDLRSQTQAAQVFHPTPPSRTACAAFLGGHDCLSR